MAVVTKTVVEYTCDRCGHNTRKPLDRQGNAEITSRETLVSFGGDVGGATNQYWLCGYCQQDFRVFMNNAAVEGRTNL